MADLSANPGLPADEYEMMEWTPERVATFWNYNSRFPEHYFTYRNGSYVIDFFARHIRRAERILDFGCGTGLLIHHLLERGYRVAGTDLSELSLKGVRERFALDSNFIGAFGSDELIAGHERFPVIFLLEVIEHLADPALDAVIESIRSLLQPGGVLLITTPNDEDLSKSYVCNPVTGQVFHRWQHVRSWTAESLAGNLRERGLEPVDVRPVKFKVKPFVSRWRRLGLPPLRPARPGAKNLAGVFRLAEG